MPSSPSTTESQSPTDHYFLWSPSPTSVTDGGGAINASLAGGGDGESQSGQSAQLPTSTVSAASTGSDAAASTSTSSTSAPSYKVYPDDSSSGSLYSKSSFTASSVTASTVSAMAGSTSAFMSHHTGTASPEPSSPDTVSGTQPSTQKTSDFAAVPYVTSSSRTSSSSPQTAQTEITSGAAETSTPSQYVPSTPLASSPSFLPTTTVVLYSSVPTDTASAVASDHSETSTPEASASASSPTREPATSPEITSASSFPGSVETAISTGGSSVSAGGSTYYGAATQTTASASSATEAKTYMDSTEIISATSQPSRPPPNPTATNTDSDFLPSTLLLDGTQYSSQTTATATMSAQTTETSSPTNMPLIIYPADTVVQAEDSALVRLLFDSGLNYPYVVSHSLSISQIIQLLPIGLKYGLAQNGSVSGQFAVQSLRAASDLDAYTATAAYIYVPRSKVKKLQELVKDRQSDLYMDQESANVQALMLQIDSDIGLEVVKQGSQANSGYSYTNGGGSSSGGDDEGDNGDSQSNGSGSSSSRSSLEGKGSLNEDSSSNGSASTAGVAVGSVAAVCLYALIFVALMRFINRRRQQRLARHSGTDPGSAGRSNSWAKRELMRRAHQDQRVSHNASNDHTGIKSWISRRLSSANASYPARRSPSEGPGALISHPVQAENTVFGWN